MATLEDAAEDLVVKLRGLDSEIEESERKLEDLRQTVEDVESDVEREWTALQEALSSFAGKVRDEQEQLHQQADETLRRVTDAQNAVAEDGTAARSEVAEGEAQVEALGQHATALEPDVETLVADGGEASAQGLADRARALEQELARLAEEARDFLRDEVVPAVDELGTDVREACQALRDSLVDETATSLQAAFDDWQSKVGELEDYVTDQGFAVSRAHALAVVEWALEQCRSACQDHLDGLDAVVDAAVRPLQDLAADVQRAGAALSTNARELLAELGDAGTAAADALAALGSVRDVLAAYSFVSV